MAGLSPAHLFLIVSPTPAGIGIVEGILAVALTSLNVPVEDATVVTITYRVFSFWFPFLIGMFTFRMLGHRRKKPADNAVQGEPSVSSEVKVGEVITKS